MPIQIGERLAQVPQVKAVARHGPDELQRRNHDDLRIDVNSFSAVTGGFRFLQGRGLESPDDVLVDDIYAAPQAARGPDTGAVNHPSVSGHCRHGQGARIFSR